MNPGDLCYVILGDEVVASTYLQRRSPVSYLVKRRASNNSGGAIWYGTIYATKREAETALFLRRLQLVDPA